MKTNTDKEYFYWNVMIDHKNKIISERLKELQELKKRIKQLEQELDGMGIKDKGKISKFNID